MATLSVLASGSKGNCIHISDGVTQVLIDAGLSGVEIEKRMKARGLEVKDLTAILVTHEHTDHIQGVGVLSRRFEVPVYINPLTNVAARKKLGKLHKTVFFKRECKFKIGDIIFNPITSPHDCVASCAFIIESRGKKIGLASDLGRVDNGIKKAIQDCDILLIEANYDVKMLMEGDYPDFLKERIQVEHLSTTKTALVLKEVDQDKLQHLVIIHVSQENNSPQLIKDKVYEVIDNIDITVQVASQEEGARTIEY